MQTNFPKVLILMSTYNGERFLQLQLESLLRQQNVEIHILIRDDGSTDNTLSILENYNKKGKLDYYVGKNLGAAYSFLDLIKKAENFGDYQYFALSDQDDYWLDNKCIEAVKKIDEMTGDYKLYTSAVYICDADLKKKAISSNTKFSYEEMFLRNESSGCTMMLNKKALKLLNVYSPKNLFIHDWWILIVMESVINSSVFYDQNAYMMYRIHDKNTMGKERSIFQKIAFKLEQFMKKQNHSSSFAKELLAGYMDYIDLDRIRFLTFLSAYSNGFKGKYKLLKEFHHIHFSKTRRKIFFIIDLLLDNL